MKQLFSKSILAKSLALFTIFTGLFSFNTPLGSDVYEIYLDHKMVLQQYAAKKEPVKTLELDKSIAEQQLDVYYSHCGKTGSKRTITIKDGQNILKQWSYPDGGNVNTKMACKVKELLNLQKTNDPARVDLVYSSQEIPEGKILATLLLKTIAVQAQKSNITEIAGTLKCSCVFSRPELSSCDISGNAKCWFHLILHSI